MLNCVGIIDDTTIEAYGLTEDIRRYLKQERRKSLSTIIGPDGNTVAGPLQDGGEGILYATMRPAEVLIPKYGMDFAGHYNRPELIAHHFRDL